MSLGLLPLLLKWSQASCLGRRTLNIHTRIYIEGEGASRVIGEIGVRECDGGISGQGARQLR